MYREELENSPDLVIGDRFLSFPSTLYPTDSKPSLLTKSEAKSIQYIEQMVQEVGFSISQTDCDICEPEVPTLRLLTRWSKLFWTMTCAVMYSE